MNQGAVSNGIPSFTDITRQADVQQPYTSFPAWFWDYNNDGRLDLFVSGYYATAGDVAREYLGKPTEAVMPRLYRNEGVLQGEDGNVGQGQVPIFTDVTKEAGLHK